MLKRFTQKTLLLVGTLTGALAVALGLTALRFALYAPEVFSELTCWIGG